MTRDPRTVSQADLKGSPILNALSGALTGSLNPVLSPQDRIRLALENAESALEMLRAQTDAAPLQIVEALWNFAVCAGKASKLGRAQEAYLEILEVAPQEGSAARSYFGGALLRQMQLMQFEGDFAGAENLLERYEDRVKNMRTCDRCCIALLAAASANSAGSDRAERDNLQQFGDLVPNLNYREVKEFLPWTRVMLDTFDRHNLDPAFGVAVVTAAMKVFDDGQSKHHPDEYVRFCLEKARSECLSGAHDESRITIETLAIALEEHVPVSKDLEMWVRKGMGYMLQKMEYYTDALRETNEALALSSDQIFDVFSLRIQQINILTLMGRANDAQLEFKSVVDELQDELPRGFMRAVARKDADLFAAEFANWEKQGRAEDFTLAAEAFAAVTMLEVQLVLAPSGDLPALVERRQVIEFVDEMLRLTERRQQLIVEEATLRLSREGSVENIFQELVAEYPLLLEGSVLHGRASYLLALYSLRHMSEIDSDTPLNVNGYLDTGNAVVRALREAKQYLSAANLLNLAAKFYTEYGGTEKAINVHEEIVAVLRDGGMMYSQLGADTVEVLIDLWGRYGASTKVAHYRKLSAEIQRVIN